MSRPDDANDQVRGTAIGRLEAARLELARDRIAEAVLCQRIVFVDRAVGPNQRAELDGERSIFAEILAAIEVDPNVREGDGGKRDKEGGQDNLAQHDRISERLWQAPQHLYLCRRIREGRGSRCSPLSPASACFMLRVLLSNLCIVRSDSMSWWSRLANVLRSDRLIRISTTSSAFTSKRAPRISSGEGLSRQAALEQASRQFGHRLHPARVEPRREADAVARIARGATFGSAFASCARTRSCRRPPSSRSGSPSARARPPSRSSTRSSCGDLPVRDPHRLVYLSRTGAETPIRASRRSSAIRSSIASGRRLRLSMEVVQHEPPVAAAGAVA